MSRLGSPSGGGTLSCIASENVNRMWSSARRSLKPPPPTRSPAKSFTLKLSRKRIQSFCADCANLLPARRALKQKLARVAHPIKFNRKIGDACPIPALAHIKRTDNDCDYGIWSAARPVIHCGNLLAAINTIRNRAIASCAASPSRRWFYCPFGEPF